MESMMINKPAVDAIFSAWDRPETPGCVVGVVQSGQIEYARGFGAAELDFGSPLTSRSVLGYRLNFQNSLTAAQVVPVGAEWSAQPG
ncbi:MAG: hypothetical protein IPN59_13200 [Holophaga sp.]|nr:hypothetical protein [Holophaga sp.]